jgi:hypothetical protein
VVAYASAHLAFWTLGTLIPAGHSEVSRGQVAAVLGVVLILIAGLQAAYRANGGAVGRDLAGRLLALGWVIGMRMILLWLALILLVMVLAIAAAATRRELSGPTLEISAAVVILLANLVFFWRLAHHLKELSRGDQESRRAAG